MCRAGAAHSHTGRGCTQPHLDGWWPGGGLCARRRALLGAPCRAHLLCSPPPPPRSEVGVEHKALLTGYLPEGTPIPEGATGLNDDRDVSCGGGPACVRSSMHAWRPGLPALCLIAPGACSSQLPTMPPRLRLQGWDIVWLPHGKNKKGGKTNSYGFSGNWRGFALDNVRIGA